ncbi:MAG: PTS galactitol transporter subunit IIC [Tepidanaerobacteraceae bacterium]|jgi:PTS system galactitol-specific IIC component|nr:PTS galactitol transporter subunit IIC [Tepidanaerobacteraceae bacterium]
MNLLTIVKYITDSLGPMVVMPLFLVLLGLAFRMPLLKALRAGLLVGIGFKGISLVTGLLMTSVSPAINAMSSKVGVNFPIIDMGFQTVGSAAWATPIAPLIIPVAIAVNLVMLTLGWTKTLNIDIWNMFHFILAGALAYLISGSIIVSLVIGAIFCIIALLIADWDSKRWQEYFGLEGTSCTTLAMMPNIFIVILVNKIIQLIPGIRDLDINPKNFKKLSGIGDPILLGLIIGIIIGAIGGLPIDQILNTGVGISAAMVLLPRIVSLLMEGLTPISKQAFAFMKEKYKDKEILIGMDVALGLGDPVVIACATISIPVFLGIAIILPGNGWLPIITLSCLAYWCVAAAAYSNGNLFRALVSMAVFAVVQCYTITTVAPLITKLVIWANVAIPQGATLIAGGPPENPLLLLIKPVLSLFGFGN